MSHKALRFNEIPKGKHHIFCESFLVTYWVLEDSLWKPSSISYFVSDVNEVVKLHQHVQVKVLEIDEQRKRIQLTMIL